MKDCPLDKGFIDYEKPRKSGLDEQQTNNRHLKSFKSRLLLHLVWIIKITSRDLEYKRNDSVRILFEMVQQHGYSSNP